MASIFTTPVGRLVQGSPFEPQTKDQKGNLRVVKSGPNAGQPSPQWFVAVAFAKTDPAWPAFYAILDAEARAGFPNLFPGGGPCILPSFAWKIIDGDGFDTTGKPWSSREGFAGHWVVRFTSGFAPKCFHAGRYDPADQIYDAKAIKTGYYVRVNGNVQPNGDVQKPGLYVNLSLLELSGYGPEIVSGPDANEAFGAPAALPPGASHIPVASGPMPSPVAHLNAPQVAIAPPIAAPPIPHQPLVISVQGPPVAPPQPYGGYIPPVAPPAPPAGPQMTAKAAGATYDAFIAQGWTHAQLVEQGYVVG